MPACLPACSSRSTVSLGLPDLGNNPGINRLQSKQAIVSQPNQGARGGPETRAQCMCARMWAWRGCNRSCVDCCSVEQENPALPSCRWIQLDSSTHAGPICMHHAANVCSTLIKHMQLKAPLSFLECTLLPPCPSASLPCSPELVSSLSKGPVEALMLQSNGKCKTTKASPYNQDIQRGVHLAR